MLKTQLKVERISKISSCKADKTSPYNYKPSSVISALFAVATNGLIGQGGVGEHVMSSRESTGVK